MNKWLTSTVDAYRKYFGETIAPVVYEVGSRDGNDGVELAQRILDGAAEDLDYGDVVLLEPNPPQAELIRKNYPAATVLEIAASDKEDEVPFLAIDGGSDIAATGSSSMDLSRRHIKPGDKQIIHVSTRRLDNVMRELEHEAVDIMKVDAEGYTYEILQGLGDKLHSVCVFHLETEMEGHHVTNKTSREVWQFMVDHGFLCYAREYEWGGIEDQVWVNVEALR